MTLFASGLAVAAVAWAIGYARGVVVAERACRAALAAERASTARAWAHLRRTTVPPRVARDGCGRYAGCN